MGTYTEQYQYDAVGNFVQFIHRGSDPEPRLDARLYLQRSESARAWKVKQPAHRNTVNPNGRQPQNETYSTIARQYDSHAATAGDALGLQGPVEHDAAPGGKRERPDGIPTPGRATYYVYDAAGQRVRKVTERQNGTRMKERIYSAPSSSIANTMGTVTSSRWSARRCTSWTTSSALHWSKPGPSMSAYRPTPCQPIDTLSVRQPPRFSSLELDDNGAMISYEEYYPYGSTSYQAVT